MLSKTATVVRALTYDKFPDPIDEPDHRSVSWRTTAWLNGYVGSGGRGVTGERARDDTKWRTRISARPCLARSSFQGEQRRNSRARAFNGCRENRVAVGREYLRTVE